jgi:hypothetical protein
MRRGVWVVLGLMGVAPGGALAQEAQRQPTEQTQGGSQGQGASNNGAVQQQQGAGGSGQAGSVAGSVDQPGSARGGSDQRSTLIEATGASDSAWGGSGRLGRTDTTVTPEQAGTAMRDDDTSGLVIEVPAGGLRIPGVVGARRSQSLQAQSGTGGSGQNSDPNRSAWANVPNEEIFVGTVRSATRDRLLIEGPSRRVYEFGLGDKTRIVGPNGAALSLQSLRVGMPVRTVTRPGEVENQVITLHVLGRAPSPSR